VDLDSLPHPFHSHLKAPLGVDEAVFIDNPDIFGHHHRPINFGYGLGEFVRGGLEDIDEVKLGELHVPAGLSGGDGDLHDPSHMVDQTVSHSRSADGGQGGVDE